MRHGNFSSVSPLKGGNSMQTTLNKTKIKKRDVTKDMKYRVVKPTNIPDFDVWWDSLSDLDVVNIFDPSNKDLKYTNQFKNSGTLENTVNYEIELEWLGNKINYKNTHENIVNLLIQNTGIILQGIQNSNFLIVKKERNRVLETYKRLMYTTRFSAPQNVTLEYSHIVQHSYTDYSKILSIRRNYCVTEKADGERNLCIIMDDAQVYLMNRSGTIKPLGCKILGLENSILDGELILKDKSNKNIIMFAVFDIYFQNNIDTRLRIFNRTIEERKDDSILESREEILIELFKEIEIISNDNTSNIMFIKKQFYYGNQEKYSREQEEQITKLQAEIPLLEKDSFEHKKLQQEIKELMQDDLIFDECKRVLSKEYIYKTDGLVFTPVNLAIGDEQDGETPSFNGRWKKLFKWKPPEENTIDFKVLIKKENGKDIVKYTQLNNKVIPYKTLILHVGYSPDKHTKLNACRVMNEGVTFNNTYSMVPFQPTEPYIINIEFAYVPIVNNNIFTEDKTIIKDNMIIEFNYDERPGEGFCWKPLRSRNNLNPNDFTTAINVWKTIHNPITYSTITTGISSENLYKEKYYFGSFDRSVRITKPMADFHSFIKKEVLRNNSINYGNLIDFSCGKGGDLNHWFDSKLKHVVGLDINKDNLDNINNGLCNRVLSMFKQNKREILRNVFAIWADSSKLLSSGSAAKDDLNRYYINILYGNIDINSITSSKLKKFYKMGKNGFDIASSQFSIHYFFETSIKLDIFLQNVSESLKRNGKFVGTCLNGEKVFEILKHSSDISAFKDETLLWKISKKYEQSVFNDDSSSIGYPIEVYIESIGTTITEWLVNFKYLKTKALEYDLELVQLKPFSEYYNKLIDSNITYGKSNKLTDELTKYSFLNTSFVFNKIK